MPDDEIALEVLRETGPMAVTSANRTGEPAATTVTDAAVQLGPAVSVYLDGGPRTSQEPSTILDCTKADPVVLRAGAISVEQLREVLGPVELVDPFAEQPPDDAVVEADPEIDPATGERVPLDGPIDLAKHEDPSEVTTEDLSENPSEPEQPDHEVNP